jgi:hypothetical protein
MFGWVVCVGVMERLWPHLLLYCNVARELWSFVFRLFGVDWVISGCVLDHVAGLEELVW